MLYLIIDYDAIFNNRYDAIFMLYLIIDYAAIFNNRL